MIPGTLQAAQILIALIAKEPADMPDIDRTVAMAAYMSKALDSFMQQPLEQLEAALWPELQATERTAEQTGKSIDNEYAAGGTD